VIRNEFAAYSFFRAMASIRSPLLRTFVHTLVVLCSRYTLYQFRAVEKHETWQAKFEAEGYYLDGPYDTQIVQILGWLNHPICRQSWQNLLIHRGFVVSMKTSTWQLPSQLTIIGVDEIKSRLPRRRQSSNAALRKRSSNLRSSVPVRR